ncbi:MAG: hypothetical protein HRT47_09620 [Candidatus Caenarcaniphilales bacterium]|nr:hypothetical protein [Candidatus Caenarcaniphilales bacterium]
MHLYDLVRETKESHGQKRPVNLLDYMARDEVPPSNIQTDKLVSKEIYPASTGYTDRNQIHRNLNYSQLFNNLEEKFSHLLPALSHNNKIRSKDFQGRLHAFFESYKKVQDFFQFRFKEVKEREELLEKYKNISSTEEKERMQAMFKHQVVSLEAMNKVLFEMIQKLEQANKKLTLTSAQAHKFKDRTNKLVQNSQKSKQAEQYQELINNLKETSSKKEEKDIKKKIKAHQIGKNAIGTFKSLYNKSVNLNNEENFGVFSDDLAKAQKQVLKNLAKIFSSKISAGSDDDPYLANILDGERFKGVYKQILDVYELAMEIAMDKTNPYERPNFSDKLVEYETVGKSWSELDSEDKEIINNYIKRFQLTKSEKDFLPEGYVKDQELKHKKQERKKRDLIFATGYRTDLVDDVLPKLLRKDFKTTVNIVKDYVEWLYMNNVEPNHKKMPPDSTIPSNLRVLGIPNLIEAQKSYFPFLPFSMGGVNEDRALMTAQLLDQLTNNKDVDKISKYLEQKEIQFNNIDEEFKDTANFVVEKIINPISRGAFDISGTDLLMIVKVPKDKSKKIRDIDSEDESLIEHRLIKIQVKSSELAVLMSEKYKYKDTPAYPGNQIKADPRERMHLGDRKFSKFISGTQATYTEEEVAENFRRADPDLLLKMIRSVNRNIERNFLKINSEQMQALDQLIQDPALFSAKDHMIQAKVHGAEIKLMELFKEQGLLSDLALAYQKYPAKLKESLENPYPKNIDSEFLEKFHRSADILTSYLSERLGRDPDFELSHANKSLLFNEMKKAKLGEDFIKPIIFVMLKSFPENHQFTTEEMQSITNHYKGVVHNWRRDLRANFSVKDQVLENYLSEILEVTRPEIQGPEKQGLMEELLTDKYLKNIFNPHFFYYLGTDHASDPNNILSKLEQMGKRFKTPFETPPANLNFNFSNNAAASILNPRREEFANAA